MGVSNGLWLNSIGDLIGNRWTSNLDRIGDHERQRQTLIKINAVQERITDMISVLIATQDE